MSSEKQAIPNDWEHTKTPGCYCYNGLTVKRIEQSAGKVELVTRDRHHTRHSVLAEGLHEAMKKMEARL